jgi:phosphohistidine swiveling domain-containing protein
LVRALLEEAVAVNQQAAKILQKGPSYFTTLEESVTFLTKLAFYGTLLPNLPVLLSFRNKLPRGQLGRQIVELRRASYYPCFTKDIVLPLAVERLKNAGVVNAAELVHFATVKELSSGGKAGVLESREQCFTERKHFIYQQIGDAESVHWIQNPQDVIRELEPKRLPKNICRVKGQVAFPGLARGVVTVARDYDSAKDKFDEGRILVAPSTNPTMLPLMKKAAAIITDEGGITCHAAIISRELKIPCIIGTKIATKIFKDGDRVEVDAEKEVVRKIPS